MNGDGASNGLGTLVKKLVGLIAAIISFFTAMVSFILLVKGNSRLVVIIFLISGVVILWLSFFVVSYYKETKLVRTFPTPVSVEQYVFPARAQKLARIGIFTLPLLVILTASAWSVYRHRPSNKVIILIAPFEGENNFVAQSLFDQLRETARDYPDIQIVALDEIISAAQGSDVARAKGTENKASIVIWGWFSQPRVNVHFELLMEGPTLLKLRQEKAVFTSSNPKGLNVLEFQADAKQIESLTLLTIGLARYDSGDYEDALKLLTKALDQPMPEQVIDPVKIEFYIGLANLLKGNYSDAIAIYKDCIKQNPRFVFEAYLNLAMAYSAVEDYNSAVNCINKAISIRSDDPDAYINRAESLYYLGKLDDALSDINNAIDRKPGDSLAYITKGLVLTKKNSLDDAMKSFEESLRLSADNDVAYDNLGYVHLLKRQYESAFKNFKSALKLNPNNAYAYNNLGRAYFETGDVEQALTNFDKSIELSPDNAFAYFNRSEAYKNQQQTEKSLLDLQKALAFSGDLELTAKIEENLGKVEDQAAQTFILKLDKEREDSFPQRDSTKYAKLTADDFMNVDGEFISYKRELMALLQSEKYRVLSRKPLVPPTVEVFKSGTSESLNDTAEVSGKTASEIEYSGKKNEVNFYFRRVYARRNDTWQVIASKAITCDQ